MTAAINGEPIIISKVSYGEYYYDSHHFCKFQALSLFKCHFINVQIIEIFQKFKTLEFLKLLHLHKFFYRISRLQTNSTKLQNNSTNLILTTQIFRKILQHFRWYNDTSLLHEFKHFSHCTFTNCTLHFFTLHFALFSVCTI